MTIITPYKEDNLFYAALLSGLSAAGSDVSNDNITLIRENYLKTVQINDAPLETKKARSRSK